MFPCVPSEATLTRSIARNVSHRRRLLPAQLLDLGHGIGASGQAAETVAAVGSRDRGGFARAELAIAVGIEVDCPAALAGLAAVFEPVGVEVIEHCAGNRRQHLAIFQAFGLQTPVAQAGMFACAGAAQ